MAIGACDICDRQNVPVSPFGATAAHPETSAFFLCQGENNPDPYGELEEELPPSPLTEEQRVWLRLLETWAAVSPSSIGSERPWIGNQSKRHRKTTGF